MKQVIVRIADFRVASGDDVLVTYGLGSCIAVVITDRTACIAGMAHVMLPDKESSRSAGNPRKFADLCINELIEELVKNGCVADRMIAKIAGGAQMFDLPVTGGVPIGERNREAIFRVLERKGIPLKAEDTGGRHGRSVEFQVRSGEMKIKSLRCGIKVI